MTTATTAPAAGALGTLAGTGKLLRFQARRTRVYLTGWIAGIAGMNWVIAAAFPTLYPGATERAEFAATVDTPAMRSMTGPSEYIDAYADSVGAMFAHQMLLWSGLVSAVMFILLITRLTRADEETSRLEVIRSNPVGRRADLAAAVLLALLAAVALGVLVGLSLTGMEGVDFEGAVLYGAAHATVGVFFAAVTAVTAQLASYGSSATALAFGVFAYGVLMSMVGSIEDNAVILLSPFGWAQATFVFTAEQTCMPLAIGAGASLLLIWLAFALVAHRDFGMGMLQARAGRAEAKPGLKSVGSLSFRLSRGIIWAGVITVALLAAAYGSILGSVDDFMEGFSETQREVLTQGGGSLMETFASTIAMIDAFAATVFGLLVIGRARKEETGGRGELLAAAPVSRVGWPGSYLPVAMFTGTLAAVVGALVLGLAGSSSVDDSSLLARIVAASLIQLPAVWVMTALAFTLFAWLPRLGWLRWLTLVYVFIIGYFGTLLEIPDWLRQTSPFEHVPSYPAQDMEWLPMAALVITAAALTTIGYIGVKRRNLQFG